MRKTTVSLILIGMLLLSACEKAISSIDNSVKTIFPNNTATPTVTPTPQPQERLSNGENDLLAGDYDAAYAEFLATSTQATDPEQIIEALLGMGRVLVLKEEYRTAIDHFTQFLINYPSSETRDRAYFFLAKAYEGLDQPLLAADAYASYLAAQPGALDSEINEMRGDDLMEAGNPASAMDAYQLAINSATSSNTDELQVKFGEAIAASGDSERAIAVYQALYNSTTSNYYKAQTNLLMGQLYLLLEQPELAYERFQDSVNNYYEYYDTYSGLVALVEANQTVDMRMRGIVDYYAGQYSVAVAALDEYITLNPEHDASAHYYKAKSIFEMGDYEGEVAAWDQLIRDHDTDQTYYEEAITEKSWTQWAKLKEFTAAAETCLTYVARFPSTSNAPTYLERAASIYEIGGYLSLAAENYERVFNDYPGAEEAYPSLFKAGILYYRLGDYLQAQITFQRLLILALNPEEQAAANLWVAKSLESQGKNDEAQTYYLHAAEADPTGYYGIRAQQIINGQSPFPSIANYDLAVDLEKEKIEADEWMHETFALDASVDLSSPGELADNLYFKKGELYTKLGMREEARGQFEALRNELLNDPVNTYRLMNKTLDLGYYYTAIYSSRQVLDQAGLSEQQLLNRAPKYFNHIRYGVFYREIVMSAAVEHQIDPLVLFSVIRQESLFDSSITSAVGAQGLMQIMPDTATDIVKDFGWPTNYKESDLNRPMINIRLGAHHLRYWLDYFDNDFYKTFSSYNASPAAALAWQDLTGKEDVDLYMEIIRYEETSDYIKSITELFEIYKTIYSH